ncbi:patatin-like phospholipase family protein [Hansschlegelia plantiphila]|uniref:Patatin n=1 Tax=Hansschlegelia plantiphila TaxID=374655 RepID=A0A9W6IYW2_9HYPH|nr:patatin-like phospholipase family protein [Hansschlegelia plantiphila]GLK67695.1 patatin [Hansschlegelia plantiphila]
MRRATGQPSRIGLALGGGGARRLAHLHVLEAFDELGVRPAAIAGASIGSVFGAGYAAGLTALELRAHASAMLKNRSVVVAKLLKARVGRITDLFGAGSRNPALIDAEKLLPLFLPERVPATFEELEIPFLAIATDFFGHVEIVISDGPLLPAIAASSAIPGIFRPVLHKGLTLIDGAMTNPLPFDVLSDKVDSVIAVDVTGGPVVSGRAFPNAFETMLGATQILQATIIGAKVAGGGPDALIRPDVRGVTLLDFFKTTSALRSSDAAKDEAKRAIERLIAG